MMKKYLIGLIIILGLTIWGSGMVIHSMRKENKRLDNNQDVLMSDVHRYQTKDSLNVVAVNALTLRNNELRNHKDSLVSLAEELGIKVRRLQSITNLGATANYIVKTEVKDSLIYVVNDGVKIIRDTLKCIDLIEPYLKLQGCIVNDTFQGLIEDFVPLTQFVERIPKKFLFIKYGTKGIRQQITSKNKHVSFDYLEYIELKK